MKKTAIALAVAMLLTLPAFAHGGGEHVKGTVTAVSDSSITVQTVDKQEKVIAFDAKTKFQKGGVQATAQDLKVGERVVIDIHEMGEGKLHATLVRFGAKKSSQAARSEEHKH